MRAVLFILGDLWVYMSLWFIVSIIKKRADLADIAWGLGFILVTWLSYYFGHPGVGSLVINLLVTLWGLRLATHIYLRNRAKPEDSRYAAWRKSWGVWFPLRSYFQVFLLQGVFLAAIATPLIYVNLTNPAPSPLFFVGIVIWITGFIFETLADRELSIFKKDPQNRGKVLQTGVWSLSRHPNYFGEVSQWWGIYLMVLPSGWWTIISPLTITLLILGVSGIPMLERRYKGDPEYAKYQKRVSPFFPLPPKHSLVK